MQGQEDYGNEITYYVRYWLGRYACRDVECKAHIGPLAFKNGDLYYFRQGDGYLVLSRDSDGKWYR